MFKLNPYIAGNPVGGGEAFIGRADILREVLRVLRNPNENALVLYGQRRIGKTSVLQELTSQLPKEGPYRSVYFDLQDKATLPLANVLAELGTRVIQDLNLNLSQPWEGDVPRIFQEDFLPAVLAELPPDTSLVFLFDEFDVLDNPDDAKAGTDFFPYLRNLLALDPRLQFVFVIGRRPEDLTSVMLSIFKGIKSSPVSLLTSDETTDLVRLSEKNGTLRWSDDTVSLIYKVTGGHPYLTQQLCQEIWEDAYQDEPDETPTIQPALIEAAVPRTLRQANNALEWLWDGLGPAERIVASALAGVGAQALNQDELNQILQDSGVRILIGELQNAPRVLQDWGLIEPVEDDKYHFRVELLRRWIADRKPLDRVQEEIDYVQPVAENLFQAASGLYQNGSLEQSIDLLRDSIKLNPNHLRANQLLAELLLTQGELVEARQLLESLYEYQPTAAQPRLIQTILLQAQESKKSDEQLKLYDRVLELNENQPEAVAGHRQIWTERAEQALADDDLEAALQAYQQIGAQNKIEEITTALRQRRLVAGKAEVEKLEQKKEYKAALKLARQLHHYYPELKDGLPDLVLLERKTQLDELYKQGLGALQTGDKKTATDRLVEIISLEPTYGEATRYLHLIVKDVDTVKLAGELKRTRKELETEQERRHSIEAENTTVQEKVATLSK